MWHSWPGSSPWLQMLVCKKYIKIHIKHLQLWWRQINKRVPEHKAKRIEISSFSSSSSVFVILQLEPLFLPHCPKSGSRHGHDTERVRIVARIKKLKREADIFSPLLESKNSPLLTWSHCWDSWLTVKPAEFCMKIFKVELRFVGDKGRNRLWQQKLEIEVDERPKSSQTKVPVVKKETFTGTHSRPNDVNLDTKDSRNADKLRLFLYNNSAWVSECVLCQQFRAIPGRIL